MGHTKVRCTAPPRVDDAEAGNGGFGDAGDATSGGGWGNDSGDNSAAAPVAEPESSAGW